jgi:hypothetical protein
MEGFDLGTYSRAVSTRSPAAQRWFDIGLNWCYGFNHEEAIRCFERVLSFDPGCAMAHWGIAYAAGPFYNLTWREHGAAEAENAARRGYDHVRLAREAAGGASPAERRLIGALAARYQGPHAVTAAEFDRWDDAYAAEMRRGRTAKVAAVRILDEQQRRFLAPLTPAERGQLAALLGRLHQRPAPAP